MKEIFAYTDGSAAVSGKNKGRGGFGTYFPNLFGKRRAYSLGYKNGKTGQMEVTALLYALKAMPDDYPDQVKLIIYSDSEYVVKCFTEKRLYKWQSNDWRNSSGSVKNLKLWKRVVYELHTRLKYVKLETRHIKSHQVENEKDSKKRERLMKDPHIIGNMMADRLADYKRHKTLL